MANLGTIDRIPNLTFRAYDPNYSRLEQDYAVPGGRSEFYTDGVAAPVYQLAGHTTVASAIQGLREIVDNPDWPVSYITFPTNETAHDGWYELCGIETPRTKDDLGLYPFTLNARKLGTTSDKRQAIYWTSASETYSGWASLCAVKCVALPNDSSCEVFSTATRWTAGGYTKVVVSPSKSHLLFTAASSLSNHYLGECAVYDSLGVAASTGWQRVFSGAHKFLGDKVYQNGLLRFMSTSGRLSACVWDGLSTSTWLYVADLVMNFDGTGTITHSEVKSITPEQIEWEEIRQAASDPSHASFILRRGQYAPRVLLKTFTGSMPWYGVQWTTGYTTQASAFEYVFNQTAWGKSGCGNLAQVASSASNTDINWCAGYASANSWLAGFIYTESPSGQPYDTSDATALGISQTWATNASRIFYPFAAPFNTATLVNPLANPGFETSGAGGADIWANWTENAASTGALADDTSVKHTGGHAARLSSAGTGSPVSTYVVSGASPNVGYALNFWARGDGSVGGLLEVSDDDSYYYFSGCAIGVTGASWAAKNYALHTKTTASHLVVWFFSPWTAGSAWYDDVTLIPLGPARDRCSSIAGQALHYVSQQAILLDKAWYG